MNYCLVKILNNPVEKRNITISNFSDVEAVVQCHANVINTKGERKKIGFQGQVRKVTEHVASIIHSKNNKKRMD